MACAKMAAQRVRYLFGRPSVAAFHNAVDFRRQLAVWSSQVCGTSTRRCHVLRKSLSTLCSCIDSLSHNLYNNTLVNHSFDQVDEVEMR